MATSTDQVPQLKLRDQGEIPQLGFGVFQVPPDETAEAVTRAFEAGYRHIDTAAAYRNEAAVGEAFRASGLDREEVFITTKCFNDDHGYDNARDAFKKSLDRLELDYVDLYLIHWPAPPRYQDVETWKAFIDLQKEGLIRSIGVSNFQPDHLSRIIDETGVTPSVNQIELHPRLQQAKLRRVHAERGIVTEAWSPLAQGAVLDDPAITKIAEAHGVTPGQVVIRWHLQLGNVVIPKSVTPERIEQNFDVFGFELGDDEMASIEALEAGERTGPDPDTFTGGGRAGRLPPGTRGRPLPRAIGPPSVGRWHLHLAVSCCASPSRPWPPSAPGRRSPSPRSRRPTAPSTLASTRPARRPARWGSSTTRPRPAPPARRR